LKLQRTNSQRYQQVN